MQFISVLRRRAGFGSLDRRFARFLAVDFLFNAAGALSGFFFNIFLLRATADVKAIARFNILQHAAIPVFMIGAVWAARRVSVLYAQRLGLIVQCAAYLMLGLLAAHAAVAAIPAAAMLGAASACYYISYTPMLLTYTTNDNRDPALGALNLVNTVIGLLTPPLTGLFISGFADLLGYRLLFFVSAAVSLTCLRNSFKLAPTLAPEGGLHTRFSETIKAMLRNHLECAAMLATFAYASRFALFTYFGSLLGYRALGSESAMGILGLAGGIAALGASVAYSRTVRPSSRGNWMIGATGVVLSGVSLIAFKLNILTWVIYTLCVSVTTVFLDAPPLASHLSVVDDDPALSSSAPEVTTIREFIYAAGYALSFLPAFIARSPEASTINILIGAALFQLVPAMCVRYITRHK